jgi:hypothetical protein
MALPKINLYGYMFHGLFPAAEIRRLERRPGVYIVTCACREDSYDLEIGDTADVQSFLLTHLRAGAWGNGCKCPNGSSGPVYFAAFYCPDGGKHDRKELVPKIRARAEAEGNI